MKICRVFTVFLIMAIILGSICGAYAEESTTAKTIQLTGEGAIYNCSGVYAEGSIITISEAGEYILSGTLNNGQIIINTGVSEEKVTLFLNGVDLNNQSDAVIVAEVADKVKLKTVAGTENRITSGKQELLSLHTKDNSGAAIFTECDLDIKGNGILIVNGYINNGITCKKDLEIDGGTIQIVAANNGVKGSRSVQIKNGTIRISSGNDGIKSTNTTRAGKGWVEIQNGTIEIHAGGDGISTATELTISGGFTTIYAEKDTIQVGTIHTIAEHTLSNGVSWITE